ncbi:hypothetical protein NARC_200008 [Candidatus Nitrosocosmicus arcticus]|uniref:Uncharacterized protein n=1 Tax=Candidatus Nitrosocosmicus arcticus TaxID=2035267 RepID=A0A557SR89_9ARCH|nr:hypothetical protein NARC_200008 [Candidatus Nitrosocosmicus arcticus]
MNCSLVVPDFKKFEAYNRTVLTKLLRNQNLMEKNKYLTISHYFLL